jgi:CBS domain-containing protein
MTTPNLESLFISTHASIREAMAVIERAPHLSGLSGIALVVDEERRLLGVVTDGDIRSAILHDIGLEQNVATIMTKDPIAVTCDATPMKMY